MSGCTVRFEEAQSSNNNDMCAPKQLFRFGAYSLTSQVISWTFFSACMLLSRAQWVLVYVKVDLPVVSISCGHFAVSSVYYSLSYMHTCGKHFPELCGEPNAKTRTCWKKWLLCIWPLAVCTIDSMPWFARQRYTTRKKVPVRYSVCAPKFTHFLKSPLT